MNNNITKQASLLIIGDEILSGRTADQNINYIALKLQNKGIPLREVRVVEDEFDAIIFAIKDLKNKYDYIFTTGGIGATHDDITCEAIARALNLDLELRSDVLAIIKNYYKDRFNKAIERMAFMPTGSHIIKNDAFFVPSFYIDNIFVMAGMPSVMHKMFDEVLKILPNQEPIESIEIKTNCLENDIATDLKLIQNNFKNVKIGSYPFFNDTEKGTVLVAKSTNKNDLSLVEQAIKKLIKI